MLYNTENGRGTIVNNLILIGTGGNSRDIIDIVEAVNESSHTDIRIIGFLDDDRSLLGSTIHGYPVVGPIAAMDRYPDAKLIIGIGSPKNFRIRRTVRERIPASDDRFMTLVHPSASVSPRADIGVGSVFYPGSVVTSNAKIGNHVLSLPGVIISHDCVIGSFTCIASGAVLSGNVHIGENCYIGANATIRENLAVGDHSLIGMGAVVTHDVPEEVIVAGVPARRIG